MIEHDHDESEVERLRSDDWKWHHLAADAAADLNRREREITLLKAQLQDSAGDNERLLNRLKTLYADLAAPGPMDPERQRALAELARDALG